MLRLRVQYFPLLMIGLAAAGCGTPAHPPSAAAVDAGIEPAAPVDIGAPLLPAAAEPPPAVSRLGGMRDPIVMADCRLTVIDKQEVPSQREGVLVMIGSEVEAGADVPPERLVVLRAPTGVRRFRRLQEGDHVTAGQLLAQLDDRLARDEWLIRGARVAASSADLTASEKTRDEAKARLETQRQLFGARSTSREELRGANLTFDRYTFETVAKLESSRVAEHERNQAETVLAMHQIRSAIPGVVKTIYKKRGEAVRALEPVFQVHDLSRLRVEGLLEMEYLPRVRQGMRVVVEPARSEGPEQTLLGHLQEITAVAVCPDPARPLIVSASEDGSVRVWDRASRHERRVYWHPAAVRAVACGPRQQCLTGASDGSARLYDLAADGDQPVLVLADAHQGPVNCAAFSPDGKWCVTGGDDRDIALWDAATGALRYRFPAGHRAALTALQWTPQGQLVSAGRDGTVRVWNVGTQGARIETTLDRRSGDVAWPGVSPDGRLILLDQGASLRLLSLKDRLTECVLHNSTEATQFTTFALFSPDGRMILTAGAGEGRVQLWRGPTATTRPYEIRQFVSRDRSAATCAAFAADGSFLVTGTKDRQLLLWSLPTAAEATEQITAELTLVERLVESSARQVRVWAEVANPAGRLLPGASVTLTIYPDQAK